MTLWNPAIPNPSNVPSNDATSMQGNFNVLDTAFAVDHVNLALVTNQGFHKQLSINDVGTPPYTVSGRQSYEYSKSLASNVRTYLEYQPSGPDTFALAPAVVPLSFKAYVTFQNLVLYPQKRNFNVASLVGPSSAIVVTFNEAMPDAFYSTFISFVAPSGTPEVIVLSQSAGSLTLFVGGATLVSLAVM